MRRSCCIRPMTIPGAIPMVLAKSSTSTAVVRPRSAPEKCEGIRVRDAKLSASSSSKWAIPLPLVSMNVSFLLCRRTWQSSWNSVNQKMSLRRWRRLRTTIAFSVDSQSVAPFIRHLGNSLRMTSAMPTEAHNLVSGSSHSMPGIMLSVRIFPVAALAAVASKGCVLTLEACRWAIRSQLAIAPASASNAIDRRQRTGRSTTAIRDALAGNPWMPPIPA